MPTSCCVPRCRGNYRNGSKVSVLNIPTEEDLRAKWIRSIKREKFGPSKRSKVCEDHFDPHDILRVVEEYEEKTRKILCSPLKWPRLRSGTVPSLFPNCPKYALVDKASYCNEELGVSYIIPGKY